MSKRIDFFRQESLLRFSDGERYNQVVFLAGGGGSGKDFAIQNFLDLSSFKVFDVDQMKEVFIRWNDTTRQYPEFLNFNWSDPNDVSKLHVFFRQKGTWKTKLQGFLKTVNASKRYRPNICFNITMNDLGYIDTYLPLLKQLGYKKQNIHIVWVLKNFGAAIKGNLNRPRRVPEKILLDAHEGVFNTMYNIILRGAVPKGVDGQITVVLNNNDHTEWWKDTQGNPIALQEQASVFKNLSRKNAGRRVVKSYSRIVVKEPGKPLAPNSDAVATVMGWMLDNVPRSVTTPTP